MARSSVARFFGLFAALSALAPATTTQRGTVKAEQKISETVGGFGGVLDTLDSFAVSMTSLGDLDGDGIGDLAVGALGDDDGGIDQGAVWILFLDADGTVKAEQKISETAGGFGGVLDLGDNFGTSVCSLSDQDGDGVGDLAVGAFRDDDGNEDDGAVWILFLNADGTVKAEQKISETAGGFGGVLSSDEFGGSVASLGDLDGDGIGDLAVGAFVDDDVEPNQGAVWILFLDTDGTVKAEQKINEAVGGFGDALDDDNFGRSMSSLGDLDGDGIVDLAVGAPEDTGDIGSEGAVWILFLDNDGTVKSEQKISDTAGGFGGELNPGDRFGFSVSSLGDLDGDGIADLAVGAILGDGEGAAWILFLNPDGTVKLKKKISETSGGFGGDLDPVDFFGYSVASLGDLDGDGIGDLAVGSPTDDDGASDQGAAWILFLKTPILPHPFRRQRGPPVPFVVLPTPIAPISTDRDGPLTRRAELDQGSPSAEPDLLEFTAPPGAPLLLFEITGGRVELSDGVASYLLYEPEPGDVGRSKSVFADLSTLFPRATSETVFHLAGAKKLRFNGGSSLRNGTGVNEVALVSASTPCAGADWQAWVDVSSHPTASASLVLVSDRSLSGRALAFGEILVDVVSRKPVFKSFQPSCGATDVHAIRIPAEALGRSFSLQALILDEHGSVLTNAVDVMVGR